MPRKLRPPPAGLPTREQIRRFVAETPGRVGKREIAREFALTSAQRTELRDLLRAMAAEGDIAPAGHRRMTSPHRLPEVAVVEVTGTDADGEPVAKPFHWEGEGPPPRILMVPERRGRPALAPGERVLARLKPIGAGKYEGRTLKRLSARPGRLLGVFRPGEAGAPGRLVPTDRRAKAEWLIPSGEEGEAEPGEIVLAEPLPGSGWGLKPARIVERLGRMGEARSISLISITTHDIPTEFSPEALHEAERARGVGPEGREDLRALPLITIDGADARDFDDAVFAEATPGGFRLVVAIADVAHYVRPGSALDRTAAERGNSCYFPDRVVPMLPEALSNGWCSLRPGEDRGCLFAEMQIDAGGRKLRHRFGRGLMRSAARLTYEEVQEARDSGAGIPGVPLDALYAAYAALAAARLARGTLELDLPERVVKLGADGRVLSVAPRPRLDSHRLIEEFMVLANVAAGEETERLGQPCVWRVHAPPSEEKLESLRGFLRAFDLSLPPSNAIHPRDLAGVLRAVAGHEQAPLVNEVMLRSQSQAAYATENIGHFGLALPRYAHFTSPIRRYADLLIHRALIRGLRLGEGGLAEEDVPGLADRAEHISQTERRAALAERDAVDRYLAAFMADKVGARFAARISGVTRFGLFVTIADSGASGLVPVSTLSDDFWFFDEATLTLSGRRTRIVWHLAQSVEVRLIEASPLTGGLVFSLADSGSRPPSSHPPSSGHGPSHPGKPHKRGGRFR
jgi:ribonuclease R